MIPVNKLRMMKELCIKECKECGGSKCEMCASKAMRFSRYASSNIPIDYWNSSYKNFIGDKRFKDAARGYIENVDKMYGDGDSIAFIGGFGTGKTYMAACMLKIAMIRGYSALYYHMSDMIQDSLDSKSSFFEKAGSIDFLCIDEFDSRWVFPSENSEQLFGQTMERVFRHRFQNKMPTIICSNTHDLNSVLSGRFSSSVESLFSQFVKVLYIGGKDLRKNRAE
tara:strand:+ start:108839 stop:109510 length:672 start_codon:yes stop_codon:yes gene_type:complete